MRTEAYAPCRVLDWDTDFFGFRVASLQGERLDQEVSADVDSWCRDNAIRCLYLLARASDPRTIRCAEESGFHLVDVRVTLTCRLASGTGEAGPAPFCATPVRLARTGDLPELQQIARRAHTGTRFFGDPNFPAPLAQALYEHWITISCQGYAEAVLVPDVNGSPAGYISCHWDAAERTGRIGLFAVRDDQHGRGLGTALLTCALDWFRDRGADSASVVTQASNAAALRVYERSGFLTANVQLWYHKWYTRQEDANA